MPEEAQKKSSEELIDVGETVGAEVNLDDKGEPEKVEAPKVEKIEVEQVPEDKSFENERETKLEKKEDPDELKEYSEGVQKRIAKLTRKMREAERQKEEAIQFAQMTKAEKDRLEKKVSSLDSSYVKEFESRVSTNMDAARQALRVAIEAGDVDGQVKAQEQMAKLANEFYVDDLILIDKLKRRINATLQSIGDTMITGGVDSMEKYKYMLGQAQAYQIVIQEISNLLNNDEKEQNDGNVIDIKGSTKD